MKSLLSFFLVLFFISPEIAAKATEDSFSIGAKKSVIYTIESFDEEQLPKNIILMIGDGMGSNHITVSRIAAGGSEYKLAIDQLPFSGMALTHSEDNLVTDSAAAATTWATGKKTKNKHLSISSDKETYKTITELLEDKGYKTGLVATSSITHATPAAFYSHVDNRYKEKQIASQLISSKISVALGGGAELFNNLKFNSEGITQLSTLSELLAYKTNTNNRLLGFFAEDGIMRTEANMPTQLEMTKVALNYLADSAKTCNGFFLMSEGSQIDWAGHDNNLEYLFAEFADFDATVGEMINFVSKNKDTLLIITADHETGGLHLLKQKNNSVKIQWGTKNHTGMPVGVFAYGPGAHLFSGMMDNTDIFYKALQAIDYQNIEKTVCK
jgi:alkaline phosphatase